MLEPEDLAPMEFAERPDPFDDHAWSFEIKYDGYRRSGAPAPAR